MSDERNDDDGSDGGLLDKITDRIAGDDDDEEGQSRRAPRPTPGAEDEPDTDAPAAEDGGGDDRATGEDSAEPAEGAGPNGSDDSTGGGPSDDAEAEGDASTEPATGVESEASDAGRSDEEPVDADDDAPSGDDDREPTVETDADADGDSDEEESDTTPPDEPDAEDGADGGTADDTAEPIRLEMRGPDEPPVVDEDVTVAVFVDEEVPVEGVTVETSTGQRVRTDANGQATLTVEQPGEVAVTADADGGDRPVLGDRLDLTVRERRQLELSAERTELPVGESVSFEVCDGEADPVEGAAVTAGGTTEATDEDGRCEVAFEDAGEVTVTAEKSTDLVRYEPAETTVTVLTHPEWIDHLEDRLESLRSRSEQYREHLEGTRTELAEYRSAYIERLEQRVDDLEGDRDDLRQQVEFLEDRHETELQRTVADLVEPLVYDVRDQMVTALEHSEGEADLSEALAGAVRELEDVLAYQADVELVRPEAGDDLDRDLHHPIGTDPDAGGAEEVVDVTQPGIVVDGEVVEKAKVTVGDD